MPDMDVDSSMDVDWERNSRAPLHPLLDEDNYWASFSGTASWQKNHVPLTGSGELTCESLEFRVSGFRNSHAHSESDDAGSEDMKQEDEPDQTSPTCALPQTWSHGIESQQRQVIEMSEWKKAFVLQVASLEALLHNERSVGSKRGAEICEGSSDLRRKQPRRVATFTPCLHSGC